MPDRLQRVDRGIAALSVYDDAEPMPLPTPGHAPARYHRDGYLIVEALIARDGLLAYSDGKDTWLELRPRSELAAAAESWTGAPVTDDHPPEMVTADTWEAVSKGVHVGTPELIDLGGVAYLQATLMITSAELLAKIEKLRDASEPVQLSIGFTTLVKLQRGLYHGREYLAIQTLLQGNHTAVVDEGRAGPACRILFDGLTVSVSLGDSMSDKNKKARTDDEGAPTAMVEVTGPNGPEMVSTWLAAELEALQTMRASQAAPPPVAPAAPLPPPAATAAPTDAPPEPRDPVAAPPPTPPAKASGAEEEDKKMDSKERRKLERHATKHGATDEKLDTMDDDALCRFVVAAAGVFKSDTLAKIEGASLMALVGDALEFQPAEEEGKNDGVDDAAVYPWGQDRVAKGDSAGKPNADAAVIAEFLQRQGYSV